LPPGHRRSSVSPVRIRFGVLGCFALVLACQSGKVQRSVNPAQAPKDAGAQTRSSRSESSDGETTSSTELRTSASTEVVSSTYRDAGPLPVEAGAPRAILWGLQPGVPSPDAGAVDQALARLEVAALGSRILTHVSTGLDDALSDLGRAGELNWIVTLPFDVFAAMSNDQFEAWVGRVWAVGDRVRFLIIGQHLETDLFALSDEEQRSVTRRVVTALETARSHGGRASSASVGVGLANVIALPTELLKAADVVALSYSGVDVSGVVVPPREAFERVTEITTQLAELRPVLFQDLAYPSSEGEQDQAEFFSLLRPWFARVTVPDVRAVVVSSLHAPSSGECEAWAEEWHVDSEARCWVGMRHRDGQAKPALSEVLELLAEFAQL
jgi:hypothetical protein